MFQISVRLLDMRLLLRNYPCKLIPLFLLLDGLMVCQVHLLIIILGLNDMHRVLLMNEVSTKWNSDVPVLNYHCRRELVVACHEDAVDRHLVQVQVEVGRGRRPVYLGTLLRFSGG